MKLGVRRLIFPIALGLSATASAQETDEVFEDLVHSDVPLWGFEHKGIWPQHFYSEDGSFGCISRVKMGDWQITPHTPDTDESWMRLSNYGAFHCAMIERRSYERSDLEEAQFEYSFVIRLGETRIKGSILELWALQSKTRPGSNYTLLTRAPGDGVIESFMILQRKCPKDKLRKGPALDSWRTSYCSINTKAEMLAFAKQMAQLRPLATMRLIGDPTKKPKAADKGN